MQSVDVDAFNSRVEALRVSDYPTLNGTVYLDHAGTPPISRSLIDSFSRDLAANLYGNPHSASPSSQLSTRRVEDVRLAALKLFGADPAAFDLVFVQNATAAVKLVQDAFKADARGFWYGYHADSHTSLVGVREGAARGHRCFVSDEEVEQWLEPPGQSEPLPHALVDFAEPVSTSSCESTDSGSPSFSGSSSVMPGSFSCSEFGDDDDALAPGSVSHTSHLELFAYPAQSNLNGRRLPLSWSRRARDAKRTRYTLMDAASLVATSPLDLSDGDQAPDFTALSFYKMFGFPDLGALIVHKRATEVLRNRRYFGGGTVHMATCFGEQWHALKTSSIHAFLEDGTLPFHSIIALGWAIEDFKTKFESFAHVSAHTANLAQHLSNRLSSLRHFNDSQVCEVYSTADYKVPDSQGPIIAFNLRASDGSYHSTHEVEKAASVRNVHLRSGGLCNPGGIARSLGLAPWELRDNFSAGWRCGTEDDIVNGKPTGMLRVSLGATSTAGDCAAFLAFVDDFFVERQPQAPAKRPPPGLEASLIVEQLTVYPIKSCAGWDIPAGRDWEVRGEGLAWDREWCIRHQGTGEVLSQKKCPRMAFLHPHLDLTSGLLRVRYEGPPGKGNERPIEVAVPLSADPTVFDDSANLHDGQIAMCGNDLPGKVYASKYLAGWFSRVLEIPCQLARISSSGNEPSARHAKPHLRRMDKIMGSPTPLLLSNESPLLAVTRASLDKLNQDIAARKPSGPKVRASTFRPNMVLANGGAAKSVAYAEDTWSRLDIASSAGPARHEGTSFEVLGPCRRCQMVCIDQKTAEKREEPFVTLTKTRKSDGKVWFGVHMKLAEGGASGEAGRTRSKRTRGTIRVGDTVVAASIART